MTDIPLGFLLTIPVSFFAGFTQGLTGFGSALVAMPFFVEILPPKLAVTLSILNGLLITTILTLRHFQDIRLRNVAPLIIGSIPGIIVGLEFLQHADETIIKRLLGVLLVGYASYSIVFREKEQNGEKRPLSRAWGVLAGFFTGLIGASFSAGGPPTIIYVTMTGWQKDEIKATLSAFFLFTGVVISAGHALAGISTVLTLKLYALNAPLVLIGVFFGMRAYSRIPGVVYLRIVLFLLLLMGILLLAG